MGRELTYRFENRQDVSLCEMAPLQVKNKMDCRLSGGWMSGCTSLQRVWAGGKENQMLWTIAVILIILWALGLVTGYTMGYFIHVLLVVAIVVVLIRVIQGRKPL